MNGEFTHKVHSSAVAGWWTVLIAAIWMTFGWFFWLWLLTARPDWLLSLWGGGDLTWDKVHSLVLVFFAVFTLVLFEAVLVSVFLSVWSTNLKKLASS